MMSLFEQFVPRVFLYMGVQDELCIVGIMAEAVSPGHMSQISKCVNYADKIDVNHYVIWLVKY